MFEVIFSSIWTWLGTFILLAVLLEGIARIVLAAKAKNVTVQDVKDEM